MTSCLDSELGLFESSLLLERGLSRNTCTAYISDLRDFGAFLAARGAASVAAITRDDIVAFLSALRAAGRAERTRARRTAAIRSTTTSGVSIIPDHRNVKQSGWYAGMGAPTGSREAEPRSNR